MFAMPRLRVPRKSKDSRQGPVDGARQYFSSLSVSPRRFAHGLARIRESRAYEMFDGNLRQRELTHAQDRPSDQGMIAKESNLGCYSPAEAGNCPSVIKELPNPNFWSLFGHSRKDRYTARFVSH